MVARLVLRWKGKDYDTDGETPLSELRKLEGFFEFRHVADRMPIPKGKLRSYARNAGNIYHECFQSVNLGASRNTLLVNVSSFMEKWDETMKGLPSFDKASSSKPRAASARPPSKE